MKTNFVHRFDPPVFRALLAGCIVMALGSAPVRAQKGIEADHPNYQEAHHKLGVMAVAKGELDRGVLHLSSALNYGPPSAQLLSDLGGALYLKGEPDLAEQKLRAALMLDPAHRDARNQLELVTAKQREKTAVAMRQMAEDRAKGEAEAALLAQQIAATRAKILANAAAVALPQNMAEARAAAEVQAVIDARLANQARESAEAAARLVVSGQPRTNFNPAPALPILEANLLGMARQFEQLGKGQEAGSLYGQLLVHNPNHPEAHHRLGVIAAANGDLDRGISHFNSALNCGPPSAQLLSDLGGALFLKG